MPSRVSSSTIFPLTVDGERPSRVAAARKPPVSETAKKASESSRLSASLLFGMAISLFGIAAIIQRYWTSLQWQHPFLSGKNMAVKTVLIIGANKRIGFETARQLGRLRYRIWLGCRDASRGQRAAESLIFQGCDIRLLAIDVTSDDSVQAPAARVQDEDGRGIGRCIIFSWYILALRRWRLRTGPTLWRVIACCSKPKHRRLSSGAAVVSEMKSFGLRTVSIPSYPGLSLSKAQEAVALVRKRWEPGSHHRIPL